ncbi:MAG: hypothetical protein Q7W05_09495 [Deltaproteobacteria bacterium]|nr:hypothetical protein [Deltaproteobacteria bacterium]
MGKEIGRGKLNGLAVLTMLFFMLGNAWASNANSYITMEIKNVKTIYQELQKISAESKIIATSYNEYTNSKNKKKSINVTYEVPKSQVFTVMTKITSLGNVISQNYKVKETEYSDVDSKKKMVEYYKIQLDKAIASGSAMQETISQLNYKIQNLEKELSEYDKQNAEGYEPKVDLNIQMKEQGYENEDGGQNVTIRLFYLVGAIVVAILVSLAAGLLLGWLIFKRNRKTMPEG